MANIFPRWSNWLPLQIAGCLLIAGPLLVLGVTYYFTPKYTRVGYEPIQPVSFDHSLHVTQLGMDCRYCHSGVETSPNATVPSTQTCMNCHSQVQAANPKLAPVKKSLETGRPIPWVRVHQAPDYVYFNHAVHVNRGVSCVECHGQVDDMKVIRHDQPMSMGWCLSCHRDPASKIRPLDKVYDLTWKAESPEAQAEQGKRLMEAWHVNPPQNCAGCHR